MWDPNPDSSLHREPVVREVVADRRDGLLGLGLQGLAVGRVVEPAAVDDTQDITYLGVNTEVCR
jgi:hypothetical protein